MVAEKSAGIIVFRMENKEPEFLILHYGAGHWDFPKGHVEEGESEEQTALRETEEETGIKEIIFVPGFRNSISYFFKRKKETVKKEVIFFLAETKTKAVKLSFEHKDYKWLNYEDAMKQLNFDNAKEMLKRANDFLSSHDKERTSV